ncbi:oligosaccharide flippase family protein [Candidatus Saccharibacteria bacterium]|nr:oligosaccharide flippase family protein [Candidatus Saccharibacteria bacterium]
MSRAKELAFNTIIIGIGNFGTKVLSFFLLPIYTSCLSTKDYGTYDLFATIAAFVLPLVTALMEESMFRFLIDCKNDEEKTDVITHTMICIMVGSVLFSLLYLIICLVFDFEYKELFYGLIMSNIVVAMRNTYLRGLGKIKLYAILNFVLSAMFVFLNILFIVVLKIGVTGLFVSNIIVGAVSLLMVIPVLFRYVRIKRFNKLLMIDMLKYSIPLIPNSMCWAVINTSDRLVITASLGANENGIYSIANKFPSAMDAIYNFFYIAWKESAAKTVKHIDSKRFYIQIHNALRRILFSSLLITICVIPLAFNLLVKNDYTNAYIYIPVLLLSMYFANMSGFYGGIFSAYKDTRIMGITTIVAALVNIVIDLTLIHFLGLWAAALSTVVATFVMFVYRKIAVEKYVRFKTDIKELLCNVTILALVLVSYYCANIIITIIVLVLCVVYSIVRNKKLIKTILGRRR